MCMIRTLLENRRFVVYLVGKEVDGDHRGTAYRREVYSHHLFSTYRRCIHKRLIYSSRHALLCACRRHCRHYTEHGLCTSRGNTDLSSKRTDGVLHHKPDPRESDKDASQPLPPAESRMWQPAQHQLERCELNPLQPPVVYWRHTGPSVVV